MRVALHYIRPYTRWILLTFLFVFLQAMTDLYLPNLMGKIVDHGIVYADRVYILKTGLWMLLVSFGGMFFAILVSFLAARIGMGFSRDVRQAVFRKVSAFSVQQYDTFGTASLITRTTNDVMQVQLFVIMGLRMLVMAPLLGIGGIIMAVNKNPGLSFIFIFILPILALAVGLIGKKAMPLFRSLQKKLDHMTLILREQFTGMKVIRMFNRTTDEIQRYDRSNQDFMQDALNVNRLMALMMPVMMFLMNVTILLIVWFGAGKIDAGNMQVGDLMAFIQYAMQIMMSLLMMSLLFVIIPRAQASAQRIEEVLEQTVAVLAQDKYTPIFAKKEATDHFLTIENQGGKDVTKVLQRGEIRFEHVTFSYPGAEHPALNDLTFTIQPGKMNAIIGGTGSGKTALLQVLLRFYNLDAGKIIIDGTDIATIAQDDLRRQMAYVPQKTVLFSGTIADNLRYGNAEATDAELYRAAKISQSLSFIEATENGFATEVSQGGKNFSGGQKQRLAIARALVRKTNIYLFDDSFSALDFKTDATLRHALQEELHEATIVMVAQRIHTIQGADQIIVLDEGKIVGIGTHDELMQSCTVYQETAKSQAAGEGFGNA